MEREDEKQEMECGYDNLSREELEECLKKIADNPPSPQDSTRGAMCYCPAPGHINIGFGGNDDDGNGGGCGLRTILMILLIAGIAIFLPFFLGR